MRLATKIISLAVILLTLVRLSSSQNVIGHKATMRILALFSSTSNDLGIDHRLGKQVLKLAVDRAKRLHPNELEDVELIMQVDEVDCNNLNSLPNRVAEQIYMEFRSTECNNQANGSCKLNTDLDVKDLSSYLSSEILPTGSSTKSDRISKRLVRQLREAVAMVSGNNADDGFSWSRQIDAIIGPSCDYLVDLIARMAAYWRKPIYTVTSVGASFSRKDIYTTLTRLSPSIDHLSLFFIKVLEKFKWRHLAILVDKSQVENVVLLENIEKTTDKLRYKIPIERKVFEYNENVNASLRLKQQQKDSIEDSMSEDLPNREQTSAGSLCTPEAREVLLAGKKVARVYLLLINDHRVVRRLLLCAYELRMNNGEFSFMAFNLGLKSAGTLSNAGSEARESRTKSTAGNGQQLTQSFDWYSAEDESNNLIARQMYESLMVFSVELPTSDELSLFVEQTLDLAHQEFPGIRFDRSSVGTVAVAMHDSLLLAVEAFIRENRKLVNGNSTISSQSDYLQASSLSSVLQSGDSDLSTEGDQSRLQFKVPLMWAEKYPHGLISSLHINANGDQELDYVLSDLEPEMGLMRPVASYSKDTRQVLLLPNSYIHWPVRMNAAKNQAVENDEPPPDEPECGFTGEAERCIDRQNMYAALVVVSVLVLLIAIIATISLRRYYQIKYQMQLDDYWWRINWTDLQFISTTGSLSSNPHSVVRAIKSGTGSVISGGSYGVLSHVELSKKKRLHSSHQQVSDRHSGSIKQQGRRSAAIPVIITPTEIGGASKKGKSLAGSETEPVNLKKSTRTHVVDDAQSTLVENSCIIRSEYSIVVKSSVLAMYKNELVIVKQLNAATIQVTRGLLVELKSIRELICDNLAKFIGLCIEPERLSIVYEYCSRGSLQDMVQNEGVAMDWTLKYSIIGDLLNGLNFIHTTLLDYHGRLKSTNLVLDSRFTVKITDFGLQSLYSQVDAIESIYADETAADGCEQDAELEEKVEVDVTKAPGSQVHGHDWRKLSVSQVTCNMDSVSVRAENRRNSRGERGSKLKNRGAMRYYWTAPEHLRDRNPHSSGSKKGDIYAVGIILSELLTRKEPYYYGTNAKPHWPSIRRTRRLLQQQQQHHGAANHAGDTHSSHRLSEATSLGSMVGRQARRAQGRLKRTGASVRPVGGADAGETASIVSQESSHQSTGRHVRLSSVSGAIDEEPTEVASPRSADGLPETGCFDQEIGVFHEKSGNDSATNLNQAAIEQPHQNPEEVLDQLKLGAHPEPIRPYLPNYVLVDTNPKLVDLMRSCWAESPNARPSIAQLKQQLRRMTHGAASKNYLDNLLDRLQNYAANLERIVDGKSADIVEEKQRTEELLYQLVPKFVADKLKRNEPIIPQVFDGVTIFFSDIVGFEKYASVMSPCELVDLLNNIYCSFESIISSFDVTKIEVILDQFLVAAGISLQDQSTDNQLQSNIAGDSIRATGCQRSQLNRCQSLDVDNKENIVDSNAEQVNSSKEDLQKGTGRRGRASQRLLDAIRMNTFDSGGQEKKNSSEVDANSAKVKVEATDQQDKSLSNYQLASLDSSHYKRTSAEQIARMALCIRDLVKSFHFRQNLSHTANKTETNPNDQNKEDKTTTITSGAGSIVAATFNIRIGIHSGKVCAGIVGIKRPKFCLIGDTVNVASRMHTNSKANRIQISNDTRELLMSIPGFNIEPRGKIEVKGKGQMETFWLESSY